MMMKKRYISPATNIVQMFEMETGILYDSFIMKKVQVDQLKNIDGGEEYFGEEADKNWFEF